MLTRIVLVLLLVTPVVVQAQVSRDLSTGQRALAGTNWRLASLGPPGSETDVVAGTTVTANFGEDGRVGGSTGCNSYGGTYEVREDTISIARLVSTRRACLDQNANEQERRFLVALEAANRFRLSSNRLTIFAERGRTVLNFISDLPSEPNEPPTEDRGDAIETLSVYFAAINAKNYRRAFRLWETPPSSYEQFVRGFADTDRVRFMVEPPARIEGTMWTAYESLPTIVVSSIRGGTDRVFAVCYVMRHARGRGWRISRADVSPFPSNVRISRLFSHGCR